MKKTKLFGWALVATMLGIGFSACTNETEEVLTQESEIKLTSEITRSRVTSDLQSEQLEEGRTIGVTITGSKSGNDYVNKLWTSDGEGGLSTTQTVYWANTDIDVIAYHPFNEEWTSGTKTFTVSNDQSDENNYLNSDLLFASKTSIAKTESAISLTFSHKLAKINVTLQPEYDTDAERTKLSSAVISICNTKTSTTIDLSNGTVPTEAIGDVEEITVGTGLTASAIVIPQTVSSGTKFIKVDLGSKTFYYTLPSDKQLKSGYSHNYTLIVKETAVQIANSSEINDWTDDNEGNTGDANEEILYYANGHEYIDLGVKDSNGNPIYWATMNIGATSEEKFGSFYAWGEIESKSSYYQENYKWRTANSTSFYGFNKYQVEDKDRFSEGFFENNSVEWYDANGYFIGDGITTLLDEDDVATVLWGKGWRMPTKEDIEALLDKCDIVYDTSGLTISNKSDKTKFIFLPTAGYKLKSEHTNSYTCAWYWTKSHSETTTAGAWAFTISSRNLYNPLLVKERHMGLPIRPVYIPES